MEKHTQGVLKVSKEFPDRVVGTGSNGAGTIFRAQLGICSKEEQAANARRMTAWWSVCLEQTSAGLESDYAAGYSPWDHVIDLQQQRRSLVAALESAYEDLANFLGCREHVMLRVKAALYDAKNVIATDPKSA